MNTKMECIYDGICHLGEGPLWNANRQKLFWTDIPNRKIWVYDPARQDSSLFWQGEHEVGGFAFTRKGGMVLCTDKGVHLLEAEQVGKLDAKPRKIVDVPLDKDERFNDITVDPKGRIFAGTLRDDATNGTLYRIEKDREPIVILTGLGCSNGMVFTMDEKKFFHTESMTKTITSYDYDESSGRVSHAKVFFRGDESQGLPDGMTIDTEDNIWAAFWGESCIRRFDRDGKVIEKISVPAIQPSSVMFGGKDLSDLYITTACEGGADITKGLDDKGQFLGGHVYRYPTSSKGRAEWLADFD